MSWSHVKTVLLRNVKMLCVEVACLVITIAVGMAAGYRNRPGLQTWTGFATGVVFGAIISYLLHLLGWVFAYSKDLHEFTDMIQPKERP
jgi:hypothetical protein